MKNQSTCKAIRSAQGVMCNILFSALQNPLGFDLLRGKVAFELMNRNAGLVNNIDVCILRTHAGLFVGHFTPSIFFFRCIFLFLFH